MPDGVFVTLIKAFVMVNGLMLFFAFMTVFERKLLGRLQTRHGPNRVGPEAASCSRSPTSASSCASRT